MVGLIVYAFCIQSTLKDVNLLTICIQIKKLPKFTTVRHNKLKLEKKIRPMRHQKGKFPAIPDYKRTLKIFA